MSEPPEQPSSRRAFVIHRLLIVLVIAAAFGLRLPTPGESPPGLYHDEAHNGIDAAGVLDGELQVFFPANNGREPLFIYLTSAMVAMLGRSPAAPRLAAALIGTLSVAAVYAVGRVLFGSRVGLFGAALLAVAPWPVILGRVGFRAGSLVLVLSLAVAATELGRRRWRRSTGDPDLRRARTKGADRRWLAFGGALTGLTLYTYAAAWAVPALFGLWGVWLWLRRRSMDVRAAATWTAAATVVALPLLTVMLTGDSGAIGRLGQVSLWNTASGDAGIWTSLARNLDGTAGMFAFVGDFIPRHNIPDRPMMAPLSALLWAIGLIVMFVWAIRAVRLGPGAPADTDGAEPTGGGVARSARESAARGVRGDGLQLRVSDSAVLVMLWMVVMSLPTLLAENAPHFLRAAGALPAAAVVFGLGASSVFAVFTGRGRDLTLLGWAIVLAALGIELSHTLRYRDASSSGAVADELYYAFESGATELAVDVNDVLGTGWRGGWSAPAATADRGAARAVWLDRRLRDGWASVPYLVPTDELTLTDPYDPLFNSGPGVAFVWPHEIDQTGAWSDHPSGMTFSWQEGSTERGDLETDARRMYARIEATPSEDRREPHARFGNGLALVDARVTLSDQVSTTLIVDSFWEANRPIDRDVTAFFQVLDETSTVVVGNDAPLGARWFQVPHWRVGDRIHEVRNLDVPGGYDPARHTVIAGVYEWPSTEPVPVLGFDGETAGGHVVLEP